MDILTPRGQESLSDEMNVKRWFEKTFDMTYVETPKDRPALIDAVIVKHQVVAIAETKCRYNVHTEDFKTKFNNEWLITWEKLGAGIGMSKGLAVPFYGILYLVSCGVVMTVRISDSSGVIAVPIRLETTTTQATINGGLANRTNAFIDMKTAKSYKID
jgi:hypothetical protein